MHLHQAYDIVAAIVIVCSVLYSALPAWESFSDYPRFQRWYKFFMIFVVKIGSINFRSLMNPSIQATSNQGGTPTK